MTSQEIRRKYLEFFAARGHKQIPRASLVPQDDPTTLFTGSGMQPLIPYLLGEEHPEGQRLVNSQTCFRAEDMDEVGDSRHTTFFEMLGNWSLGDYYKEEQLSWCWEFLTKEIGLEPKKLYITCFLGDQIANVPKDTESGKIWKKILTREGLNTDEVELLGDSGSELGMQGRLPAGRQGRIFYYGAEHNWWSREGEPANMQVGEPGGPDSEVFYDFGTEHDPKYGKNCHPNCQCGRFLEVANSVFMAYKKTTGGFEELPKPNVDFGGGLERLEAASISSPDMFQISTIKPVIDGLEKLSGQNYQAYMASMRVIADHLRAATFLAVDGVVPSNKTQGYVLRRLLRRAIRHAFDLGIEQNLCEKVAKIVVDIYKADFPELKKSKKNVTAAFTKEEKIFRQTLRHGLRVLEKTADLSRDGGETFLTGQFIFQMYDTYGFPVEMTLEEAKRHGWKTEPNWSEHFDTEMENQRQRSQTAAQGMFRGGLADSSEEVVKLHTATHLMYQALKNVLGDHVVQRGSNITAERTRFDFSHPEKVTPEQIKKVEDIVNQKIAEDLPVNWKEEPTEEALKTASGAFGEKYGDTVKVYTIGDQAKPFSREICGGPHVEHTGRIGEAAAKFKIFKEESSSAGIRRVKAVLR